MNKDTAFKSTLVGLTTASLITAATVASAGGKLNVSNWAEYMAEDTIAADSIEAVVNPISADLKVVSNFMIPPRNFIQVTNNKLIIMFSVCTPD